MQSHITECRDLKVKFPFYCEYSHVKLQENKSAVIQPLFGPVGLLNTSRSSMLVHAVNKNIGVQFSSFEKFTDPAEWFLVYSLMCQDL